MHRSNREWDDNPLSENILHIADGFHTIAEYGISTAVTNQPLSSELLVYSPFLSHIFHTPSIDVCFLHKEP
jgi:hypothetical protein